MCNYKPQYPNKRTGRCEYANSYGPHGCDEKRTKFCQDGPSIVEFVQTDPELSICQCPRCLGLGCDAECSSFVEWGFGSCKHQNSYGRHGCPECLD